MESRRIKDHLDRDVEVPRHPSRIVSLCPSQTETLLALGVGPRLVGRTRYCIHPRAEIESIPHVDGTKRPDLERIAALAPDLVIAEKEENTLETVEALARHVPVYVTNVLDIPGALRMIEDLGELVGAPSKGRILSGEVARGFEGLRPLSRPLRAAYLIWRKPYMGAGSGTFIHSMLERCGFINALAALPGRYPELDEASLRAASPEVVLLSSEPFPFTQKHVPELEALLPDARVLTVDGELLSWYGARMRLAPAYLDGLLRGIEG